MDRPTLAEFHVASRALDFVGPLEALLGEFRRGNIADRNRTREAEALASHLGGLQVAWDQVFPPFPDLPWRRRSFWWEYHRGERDAYLKRLLVKRVPGDDAGDHLIVNPATVFGRHARAVARALPDYSVIGTDYYGGWYRMYRCACFWKFFNLPNFRFVRENIFQPDLSRHPAAVTFWGACGSVTDGCMDYAVATASPFLICRSCCHDNIGGNTAIVKRRTPINYFFRWKNYELAKLKRMQKRIWKGLYFSPAYDASAYPRSAAARKLMDTKTIIAAATNSADSDICRALIDLDRCLFLRENGYDVMYREELFFAHKPDPEHASCPPPR